MLFFLNFTYLNNEKDGNNQDLMIFIFSKLDQIYESANKLKNILLIFLFFKIHDIFKNMLASGLNFHFNILNECNHQ